MKQPHPGAQRALTLAALGMVYGDIGTSPLYAMKEVFGSSHHPVPTETASVLGILSIVLWALFAVQRRGTAAVGAMFGPVMVELGAQVSLRPRLRHPERGRREKLCALRRRLGRAIG
jgi:K+ transporter